MTHRYKAIQASSDVSLVLCKGISTNHGSKYHQLLEHLTSHEGNKQAVKVLKGYYLIATKVALRQPFKPLAFRKSDSDGFPKDIKFLKGDLQSQDYRARTAALTIARCYVLLYSTIDYDTSSITSSGPQVDSELWYPTWQNFLTRWCKKFRFTCPEWSIGKIHGSTKRGPNGPALLWAHIDLLALYRDKVLWNNFVKYNLLIKQEGLTEYATNLVNIIQDELPGNYRHSKLSFLREGGGKTRVIAIGDYWSRESLMSLHKALLGFLRQLRTDGTYDQNRIAEITRKATRSKKPVYCFDLSNATDRFPVLLQKDLISQIIGEEAAITWQALLTDRTFTTQVGDVRYAVGQPMGIQTSWPAFALTHHAFIEFCAFRCGINHFEDYVVLGDDVAIFNKEVSLEYETLLTSIDVPISREKSTISLGPPHHVGEIAKRLFINGVEISPVPPDIVLKARTDITLFPMLIRVMLSRGCSITSTVAGALMDTWYGKSKSAHFRPLLGIPSGLPGHIKYVDSGEPCPETGCPAAVITADGNNPLSHWTDYAISDVIKVLLRKRIKSLTQKAERMTTMHRAITTMKGRQSSTRVAQCLWLRSQGVPIPNSVLHDLSDVYYDMNFFLPIIHVLQKELMDLMILSDKLEDADPDIVGSLDLKEYVPDITLGKYFTTYQEQKERRTSLLMLEVLATMRTEFPRQSD